MRGCVCGDMYVSAFFVMVVEASVVVVAYSKLFELGNRRSVLDKL